MRRSWLGHVTGAAALAFLVAGLFVPLAAIVWRGVAPAGGTPLAGLVATLTDPYYLGRLWFTTWQALLSTALTVAVGLPTALLLARYGFAGRRLLTAAFSVPFVMPTVVAGMGFLALAGPRGLLGVDLRGTLVLVLAAHVFYNFAIVARLVSGFLEGLGPRLEQAAATLGAGAWRTLWRVTLPLALPATVAAATLVFVFCFTSFGVVLILAPEARFATLEVELYRLTLRLLRLDAAAALALVQLVVVGGLGLAYTRLQARLAVPFAAGRAVARRPRGVGAALLGADLLVIAAGVLAPPLALTVQALTAPAGPEPAQLADVRGPLDGGGAGRGHGVRLRGRPGRLALARRPLPPAAGHQPRDARARLPGHLPVAGGDLLGGAAGARAHRLPLRDAHAAPGPQGAAGRAGGRRGDAGRGP